MFGAFCQWMSFKGIVWHFEKHTNFISKNEMKTSGSIPVGGVWLGVFLNFGQSQASCVPLLPVFILNVANCLASP